jgi:transposase
MSIIKQAVGIDISKENFTACVCQLSFDQNSSYSKVSSFTNDKKGFVQLVKWVKTVSDKSLNIQPVFLMEATGVYYEDLAYYLHKEQKVVHVVLPNTSKHYFSSLNIKSKTDGIDAKILSKFGVERKHKAWQPPTKILLELRNLTRYYVQLQEQKTILGNIKHSKESSYSVQSFIMKSNKQLIHQIDQQILKCKQEIEMLIESDQELNERIKKILTIKGVGLITVATIVAETTGFEQFSNAKQLVSYAGYDVVQRESGTSIKGKTRISKKGNRFIRNSLFFPGMVACSRNPKLKETYLRIIEKKPSKMIGQVAIQRKLLILIYTLWKNNCCYDENYKKVVPVKTETTQDSFESKLLLS